MKHSRLSSQNHKLIYAKPEDLFHDVNRTRIEIRTLSMSEKQQEIWLSASGSYPQVNPRAMNAIQTRLNRSEAEIGQVCDGQHSTIGAIIALRSGLKA